MDSIMEVFMVETNDFLSKIEEILIENEKTEGGIRNAIPEIFRIMHTIKSSSAMMSLDNISKLTHKVEDLFYYLRENKPDGVDDSKLTDIVLDAVDFIKRNIDGTTNEDPTEKIQYVGEYLDELKNGGARKSPAPAAPASAPAPASGTVEAQDAIDENKTITVYFKRTETMVSLRALEIVAKMRPVSKGITTIPQDFDGKDDLLHQDGLVLLVKSEKTEAELQELLMKLPYVGRVKFATEPKQELQENPDKSSEVEAATRQFVEKRRDAPGFGKAYANVEVAKLDYLVDLVGETLILQMELARDIEQRDFVKGENAVGKLKKMILNLQEAALSTRMVPVRDTFLKMHRIVRDMCRKQDKDVEFITSGEETEVDRSIVENISSPLMHIIRNAIDHGVEAEEERLRRGKEKRGRVELTAYTEGRNVVIAVTDDGGGLDADRILKKALDIGLVTESQAETMSNEEINGLIFLPGFSTNKEVTEYSGRGVGMDVVNENIKKMNGKVTVYSEKGQGTKVVMKIPLTLAIIDTIILRVGEETCAIPVNFISKILHFDVSGKVRNVNGGDVVLLEDTCYRILNLFEFYGYEQPPAYQDGIMILVGSEGKEYVVFADEIVDRQDVVVKPAPALFKTIGGISGCTILGDGKISLILDTDELLAAATRKRSS